MSRIDVAIIAPDGIERARLQSLIVLEPGFAIDGTFESVDQAVQRACEATATHWDLILLDLQGAWENLQAIRHLKALRPETQIVALFSAEDPELILEAIRAGANGYILKLAVAPAARETVHMVVAGGSPITPGVARAVLELAAAGPAPEPAAPGRYQPPRLELTDREREVLQHMAAGGTAAQVASLLEIGINGVRTHVRHVYRRLQMLSVAEAVLRALRGLTNLALGDESGS